MEKSFTDEDKIKAMDRFLGLDTVKVHDEDENSFFKSKPEINVITKDVFEERVREVFHILWEVLSKSFGPYGAPTLIYNYPFQHVTKDGFTIMSNLSFNAAETKTDEAIKLMAEDICGRLNYAVGDGTTSAVVATYSIYNSYQSMKSYFDEHFIMARDILKRFEIIKDRIIEKLRTVSSPVNKTTPDALYDDIYRIVYISSNGNEEITEMLASLYKEIGCPGISSVVSQEGITKKNIINGYKFSATLNDRLYINADDDTMKLDKADIIIFRKKIMRDTYQQILKPLNTACAMRGRNLIVMAPAYDEVMLHQLVAPELNKEFSQRHEVNMVLTTYSATTQFKQRLLNDFAMLVNTTPIGQALEEEILAELNSGQRIESIFNIDDRDNIEHLIALAYNEESGKALRFDKSTDIENLPEGCKMQEDFTPLIENYINLGYASGISLGLKDSTFSGFSYDELKYEAVKKEAERSLNETVEKYKRLGTFNLEVSQAQSRFYSLNLKMGSIEVGGDTELEKKLLKDSVDDAVRAAESAFDNGTLHGCGIDVIRAILELKDGEQDELTLALLEILFLGFCDVYRTVLSNAFDDVIFSNDGTTKEDTDNLIAEVEASVHKRFGTNILLPSDILESPYTTHTFIREVEEIFGSDEVTLHNIIIARSILTGEVFDVSKGNFTNDIIQSARTDEEILKACIGLMSMLITGNQMIVTQKHNFQDIG